MKTAVEPHEIARRLNIPLPEITSALITLLPEEVDLLERLQNVSTLEETFKLYESTINSKIREQILLRIIEFVSSKLREISTLMEAHDLYRFTPPGSEIRSQVIRTIISLME